MNDVEAINFLVGRENFSLFLAHDPRAEVYIRFIYVSMFTNTVTVRYQHTKMKKFNNSVVISFDYTNAELITAMKTVVSLYEKNQKKLRNLTKLNGGVGENMIQFAANLKQYFDNLAARQEDMFNEFTKESKQKRTD